nr:MAG TPA: hypothetical protein [Microviridae sp.]
MTGPPKKLPFVEVKFLERLCSTQCHVIIP